MSPSKTSTVVALVVIILGISTTNSMASSTPLGQKCVKSGSVKVFKKVPYICTKTASGLHFARKLAVIPSPSPTPLPSTNSSIIVKPNLLHDGDFNGTLEKFTSLHVPDKIQVQVSVSKGKIVSLQLLVPISDPNSLWAITRLIQDSLTVQSDANGVPDIQGVPDRAELSQAFYDSLVSALNNSKSNITAGNESAPAPTPSPVQPSIQLSPDNLKSFSSSAGVIIKVIATSPNNISSIVALVTGPSGIQKGMLATLSSGTVNRGTWALTLGSGLTGGNYSITFTLSSNITCTGTFTITNN